MNLVTKKGMNARLPVSPRFYWDHAPTWLWKSGFFDDQPGIQLNPITRRFLQECGDLDRTQAILHVTCTGKVKIRRNFPFYDRPLIVATSGEFQISKSSCKALLVDFAVVVSLRHLRVAPGTQPWRFVSGLLQSMGPDVEYLDLHDFITPKPQCFPFAPQWTGLKYLDLSDGGWDDETVLRLALPTLVFLNVHNAVHTEDGDRYYLANATFISILDQCPALSVLCCDLVPAECKRALLDRIEARLRVPPELLITDSSDYARHAMLWR